MLPSGLKQNLFPPSSWYNVEGFYGKYLYQVWNNEIRGHWQWNSIHKQDLRIYSWLQNLTSLHISGTPPSQWTSWSYKLRHIIRLKEEVWWSKGTLDKRAQKYLVGISNHTLFNDRGDSIQTNFRGRGHDTSGSWGTNFWGEAVLRRHKWPSMTWRSQPDKRSLGNNPNPRRSVEAKGGKVIQHGSLPHHFEEKDLVL